MLSEPSLASWRLASRRTNTFQGQLFHPRSAPPWRYGPRARGLPAQATGFSTHYIMALRGAQRKYSHTPWLMISAGNRWCVYGLVDPAVFMAAPNDTVG